MTKTLFLKNPEKLKEALDSMNLKEVCAIETEYGDKVIDENKDPRIKLALNHHGSLSQNDPPSKRWDLYEKLKKPFDEFLVSHLDLDTLFGMLWASKILRPTEIATKVAELVAISDLKGFHYVEEKIFPELHPNIKYRYLGVGMIANKYLKQLEVEKDYEDVSKIAHKTLLRIKDYIIDGPTEIEKRKIIEWLEERNNKAKEALVEKTEFMNIFVSDDYNPISAYTVDGETKPLNLIYIDKNKAVILAAYDEETAKKFFGEKGVIEPLQRFFGSTAGGRISVGGAPRELKVEPEKFWAFKEFLEREYLNAQKKLIQKKSI